MLKYPLMWFVTAWRKVISPLYGDVCKFHPSCSSYGLEALRRHGGIKGGYLTIKRLIRCHPWSQGGVDYVPGTPEARRWAADQDVPETAGNSRTEPIEVDSK